MIMLTSSQVPSFLLLLLLLLVIFPLSLQQMQAALESAEGRALLQWKETLSNTDGVLDSWSFSNLKNICNWTGITCNTATTYVSKINMSGYNFNLTGPDGNNKTVIIIVVCIAAGLVGIAICIFIIYRKLQKRKANSYVKTMEEISSTDEISVVESLKYDLITLQNATNNFSEANKLGEGGFGPVYKGKLENGLEVAVKRLSENSRQGNLEFKNEVALMARLQHRNLVRLLGYCQEGREMILIYEFVPKGGLDNILFDPVKRGCLDWGRRYKIIESIARGLVYLHEDSCLRIIHRDLKASNILLDVDLNPKIADFGTARLFTLDENIHTPVAYIHYNVKWLSVLLQYYLINQVTL